jgi:methionyl-tRNA formyltransferase
MAAARGLKVLQPERLKKETFEAEFEALDAELGVVAAYGKILPEWLLAAPRHGMINVHASLLPKYRGAAPVHRAIINGEAETGVTIMRVVKALDAGPMLAHEARPIGLNETSEDVERALAAMGAPLLLQVVEDLASGRAIETAQDDRAATYAHRLTKEEGALDFRVPALDVHNRIRGLRPWPAAWTFVHGRRLVIHHARPSTRPAADAEPGTCLAADAAGITIVCGDGRAVDLLQVQPEGRRVMTAREFLAGHALLAGERLG